MTSEIKVDTISEQTSANGVTIDGLTIKDGNIIGDVALAGTTPTFTIGDGGAEDAALIFDGNALDFYIALDDSADDLVIGTGTTIGSNAKFTIENEGNVKITRDDNVYLSIDSTQSNGDEWHIFNAVSGTTSQLQFKNIDQSKLVMLLDETGKVGIGTTSMGADVQIGFHDTATTATSMGTAHANDATLLIGGANSGTTQGSIYLGGQNVSADGVAGAIYGFSGGNQSSGIEFLEGSSDAHGQIKMSVAQGTGGTLVETMRINEIGAVTMPLQPAFQVRPSSNQNNMASNATIVLGTEVFDVNADFASNTFTAPVTGKYQLSFNIRLQQLQSDSDYALINIETSNRTYQHILNLSTHVTADVGYQHFSNSLLCDMDANDTAYLVFQESGGTTGAVDVSAAESNFTGYLAC